MTATLEELEELAIPPLRDHQQFIIDEVGNSHGPPTIVQAITGSGKTRAFIEIARRWRQNRKSVLILTHRKVILDQIEDALIGHGLEFGKIASGHTASRSMMLQLGMNKTLAIRIAKGLRYRFDLVLVDEAHVQCSGGTLKVLRALRDMGSYVVGLTATPIGVGDFYERLIVGCNSSEGRRSGATLWAKCYNVQEPDRRFVKKVKVENDESPQELSNGFHYLQQIVGRVYEHWLEVNPERKPTIAFCPGVDESLWLAKDFHRRGVVAAHVDGNRTWYDGQTYSTALVRRQLSEKVRAGEIELVCNRFVLREGWDATNLYCALLCTRYGAESAYLQSVGRVLRAHPGMDEVVIADHGGNLTEFGSPNDDRDWSLDDTNERRAYERHERKRQDIEPEPITCPKCSRMRLSGITCPHCGHTHRGYARPILQTNGRLIRVDSKQHVPKRVAAGDKARKLWERSFWAAMKSGASYRLAFARWAWKMQKYHNTYGVKPDPNWPGMPKHIMDHCKRVQDVPEHRHNPIETKRTRRKDHAANFKGD